MPSARRLLAPLLVVALWLTGAVPCGPAPEASRPAHRTAEAHAADWCGSAPDRAFEVPCPCGCEDEGSPSSIPGWALRSDPAALRWAAARSGSSAAEPQPVEAPPSVPDPVPIANG